MSINDLDNVTWLEPWKVVSDQVAMHLTDELRRELNPRHILYQRKLRAIALNDSEDALFVLEGESPNFAVVHLTWSGKQDFHDDFPWTVFYQSVQAFMKECMQADHDSAN